jgi:hypothetical protein
MFLSFDRVKKDNPGVPNITVYFRVLTSTEDFIFRKQLRPPSIVRKKSSIGQAKLHTLCDILLCKGFS